MKGVFQRSPLHCGFCTDTLTIDKINVGIMEEAPPDIELADEAIAPLTAIVVCMISTSLRAPCRAFISERHFKFIGQVDMFSLIGRTAKFSLEVMKKFISA